MAIFLQSLLIETSGTNLAEIISQLKAVGALDSVLVIDHILSTVIEAEEGKSSIGIKEVQELIAWNSLKSENIKVALIRDADLLTTQAQNSLLKVIEEPNVNNLILLQTKNIESILETIQSRCKKYRLNNSNENHKEFNLESYLKANYGERKTMFQDSSNLTNKKLFLETILERLLQYFVDQKEVFTKEVFNIMIELLEYCYLANRRGVNFKLLVDYLNFNLIKIK